MAPPIDKEPKGDSLAVSKNSSGTTSVDSTSLTLKRSSAQDPAASTKVPAGSLSSSLSMAAPTVDKCAEQLDSELDEILNISTPDTKKASSLSQGKEQPCEFFPFEKIYNPPRLH